MQTTKLKYLDKWHLRFLQMAEHVAEWSKDPSTKVGAVIVRPDRTIASVGFNGFARGVLDTAERLSNRELKYPLTVHAEPNAILSAHEPVRGHTLYVSPLSPCSNCAGVIIQSGIGRVVAKCGHVANPSQWSDSFKLALTAFDEAGVSVILVED